jgi:hypothetical protein
MIVGRVELQTNDETQTLRLDTIDKAADGSGYICQLLVRSRGFACQQRFIFDDEFLLAFIDGLTSMDHGQPGEAVLKGRWETDCVRIEMNALGHVFVSGEVSDCSELPQQLRFGLRTDQTVLRPFIQELKSIYEIQSAGASPRIFEYRVTKYDPQFRTPSGAYARNEWTSISDIGRSFDGTPLTREEYQRVEDAYVETALGFLRESGVTALTMAYLENHAEHELQFGQGSVLNLAEINEVIRQVLREEFWCKLETSTAYLHFGYDYYMYLGVPLRWREAESLASKMGLFVENFRSPYAKEN